tara:strand:- start:1229 stop:1981 length:753 start_codon:yes stop_codon:yes gene_type:complete
MHDVEVTTTLRRHQALDRMIKIQLLDLRLGSQRLLHLVDDDLLRLGREELTLLGVDVGKVGEAVPLVRLRRSTPRDAQLHVMVRERDQREDVLPALTEEEAKRVETGGVGVVIFVDATETGLGEVLREHLRRNVRGEEGVLGVDDRTTDQQFNLVDDRRPVDNVFVSLGTIALDGLEVHITEKVTFTLDANRGHATVGDVALDDLTLNGLRKIRVSFVRTAEVTNFGVAYEMGILLADGHELGDSTRHLL